MVRERNDLIIIMKKKTYFSCPLNFLRILQVESQRHVKTKLIPHIHQSIKAKKAHAT